jgi:hypothetical protein
MVAAYQAHTDAPIAAALQQVNPLENEDWDDLTLSHPKAAIFHSRAWAQVLAGTYGYRPEYFLAAENQSLHALLPLFEVRSWITGVRGVSLPFTDSCEPLESAHIKWADLFSAAQALGRERQWSYLEIRGVPERQAECSARFYTHEIDLSPSEDSLFENCEASMRRAIRKAEKESIRIEAKITSEAMDQYYALHRMTRQKHGIPPQPLRFFRNIYAHIIAKGLGTILLARKGPKVVAGAIFFHFGESAIYKFGASDVSEQQSRPNNLLLWRGALHMRTLGARRLSFGRTSLTQDGLRRFKLGYGARESTLAYTRFSFHSNQFAQAQADRSTGLHATLFRYCPRSLSRLAGAAIYPHIG